MHEDANTPTGAESNTEFCTGTPKETVSTDILHSLILSQDSMQKSETDCQEKTDTPSVIIDGIRMNLYFGAKEDVENLAKLKSLSRTTLPIDTPFSEVMRSS